VLEPGLRPSFQDDRDIREWVKHTACGPEHGEFNRSIATVDEQLQTIGAKSFAEFERSVATPRPFTMPMTVKHV